MAVPIEIDVWEGEIAELEVDALVVPANESLFMTAGAAASVKRHSGEEVERAAVAQGPIAAGTAIATPGGPLAARYVIHAVAVGHDLRPDVERLRRSVRAVLDLSRSLGLRRLAIAPLGTERGVFTPGDAAELIVDELDAGTDVGLALDSVVFATASPAETAAFSAAVLTTRPAAR